MIHALTDLVDTIPNASLRKLTARVLDSAPAAFWTAPCAPASKYHPSDCHGKHGLIKHTRKAFRLALTLLKLEGFSPTQELYSVAIAATLLHDAWQVTDEASASKFDHPKRCANAILDVLREYPNIPHHSAQILLESVEGHHGRWNTHSHSSVVLPVPSSAIARLVHTAVFLASSPSLLLTPEK